VVAELSEDPNSISFAAKRKAKLLFLIAVENLRDALK
jgi:hypothetical protein